MDRVGLVFARRACDRRRGVLRLEAIGRELPMYLLDVRVGRRLMMTVRKEHRVLPWNGTS